MSVSFDRLELTQACRAMLIARHVRGSVANV
jgi:hypothetical protein